MKNRNAEILIQHQEDSSCGGNEIRVMLGSKHMHLESTIQWLVTPLLSDERWIPLCHQHYYLVSLEDKNHKQ